MLSLNSMILYTFIRKMILSEDDLSAYITKYMILLIFILIIIPTGYYTVSWINYFQKHYIWKFHCVYKI